MFGEKSLRPVKMQLTVTVIVALLAKQNKEKQMSWLQGNKENKV